MGQGRRSSSPPALPARSGRRRPARRPLRRGRPAARVPARHRPQGDAQRRGARARYQTPGGARIDGSGVTVAVIDSGIDGTHPFFADEDGDSKVVRNRQERLRRATGPRSTSVCFQEPPANDTDTDSGGGHGTHVAGIAAGYEVTTTDPAARALRGAAPGAKLVGLSVGAAIGLLNANAAMNWVVEHQRNPCATAAEQDGRLDPACPPIRATNHSYGPVSEHAEGDLEFDEDSATVTLQRTLVAQGVTPVWAAGNSGGDGTIAATNPPAMDPTPGVAHGRQLRRRQHRQPRQPAVGLLVARQGGDTTTYPDLSAPGDLITSSCRPQLAVCTARRPTTAVNYQTISGTSMARRTSPGVVAQLAAGRPDHHPGARSRTCSRTPPTSSPPAPPTSPTRRNADSETSFDKGHGLVDVLALLARRQGLPDPDAAPPLCAPGDAQLVDPEGDATQVFLTDVPGGPSQRDLDLREGRLSLVGGALRIALRLTDVDAAAPPTDEYLRIAVTRTGDPVVDVVASREAGAESFTATSGTDPLDPTVEGTSATLTGSFDEATDVVTVVIGAAQYAELVPGRALATGDEFKLGAVLAQRNTGLLTLTADSANGSCGFTVAQPTQEVPVEPTGAATPTAGTASPTPTDSGTPAPTPTETSASPTASPTGTPSAERPALSVQRFAGDSRITTAVQVSRRGYPTDRSAGAVVLARSDQFADALAGTPLAADADAPLLLSSPASLSPATRTELQRVLATGGTVHLLGGVSALSAALDEEVRSLGFRTERHAGADRYATAVAVAEQLGSPSTVLLATGRDFADGLTAGVAAGHVGAAVLLSDGDALPRSTADYLAAHAGDRYAVGGPASRALPPARSLAGADRFATAARVAQQFFPSPSGVGVASGRGFADAMAGGPLLIALGHPLVLAERTSLPSASGDYLGTVGSSVDAVAVFGGPAALDEDLEADVRRALGR